MSCLCLLQVVSLIVDVRYLLIVKPRRTTDVLVLRGIIQHFAACEPLLTQ